MKFYLSESVQGRMLLEILLEIKVFKYGGIFIVKMAIKGRFWDGLL